MRRLCIATTLLFIHATSAVAHDSDVPCKAAASSGYEIAAENAEMQIVEPAPNEVLRSRTFKILYTMSGDLVGNRLDHVHWKLSEGDNETAPDLTGVIDVTASRDGDHSLTLYMATPEHLPINGKKTINFKIVTQGLVFLSPSAGSLVKSNDVKIEYNTFGSIPDNSVVKFSIDGSDDESDGDLDGVVTLKGLSDGSHTVRMQLVAQDNTAIGEASDLAITVRSPLNGKNASKALSYGKQLASLKSKSKIKDVTSKLDKLLKALSAGGSSNPARKGLTQENVTKAKKALKAFMKSAKSSNRRTLLTALEKLAS